MLRYAPGSGDRVFAVVAVVVVVALAGCRTAGSRARSEPAPTGQTSYEAVLDAGSRATRLAAQREFLPAAPTGENPSPVYPDDLLPFALPRQEIVVRLVLDESGRVAEIQQTDSSCAMDSRFRNVFETAIRDAVQEWRFRPAVRRTYVDAPDDGSGLPPYKVLRSEAPTRTYFDIRFVFEVRDGRGIVLPAR